MFNSVNNPFNRPIESSTSSDSGKREKEQQQEKKEIRNLKALIYFTDGDGIYPQSKPDYETAFVFLEKTARMDMVPDWAYKLIVPARTEKQEEEL